MELRTILKIFRIWRSFCISFQL